MQTLMKQLLLICLNYGLTMSLENTKFLCQGTDIIPSFMINGKIFNL